ncbi:hypothetical protein N5D77_06610 [Comamonas thiooxydans]|uniref:Uncharacterized protein n=1 Tax=Comamonas thiooxydans TaxID=363952 RepID=A0AA42PXD7_9BURK|nr:MULTISPECIES: hypothetical protein [Comamonas]MDH1333373.1 hypothetical protein [Comamonas thiooxydans]MDH1738854.1 hypothetical protein [Comamonas thiooxydans]MDH1786243.1 hypothetical protein [Comamonas thiooxydans]TFF61577.1 hypothetical protein EIC84_10520 [Comamonas sp. A23]
MGTPLSNCFGQQGVRPVMAAAAHPSLPNFGAARSEQLPIYHFLRAVYRTETYEAPSRIWQAAINIH